MAKTPEELEAAQNDLAAAIASLQTDLKKLPNSSAEIKTLGEQLAALKAEFVKLTPKAPDVTATDPEWLTFLRKFVPTI